MVDPKPNTLPQPAPSEDSSLLDVLALMGSPSDWKPPAAEAETDACPACNCASPPQHDNGVWIEPAGPQNGEQPADPPTPGIVESLDALRRAEQKMKVVENKSRDEEENDEESYALAGPISDTDVAFFDQVFLDMKDRPRRMATRQMLVLVPSSRKRRLEKLCRQWRLRQSTLVNGMLVHLIHALENPTPEWLEVFQEHKETVEAKIAARINKKNLHLMVTGED